MLKDDRDPETIGQAIAQLKTLFPDKSAAERADILENLTQTITYTLSSNGHKNTT